MPTMPALVKRKAEPGLWLEDVPVPVIGINDVLIEVLRTGICGTDLHIYNWDAWAQKTIPVPLVVGSTAAGDSFNAGYPAARLFGADPEAAARLGGALAARVIAYPGAIIPAAAMADLSIPGP